MLQSISGITPLAQSIARRAAKKVTQQQQQVRNWSHNARVRVGDKSIARAGAQGGVVSLRQQSTGRLLKGAMSALVLGSVLYLGLYEFPKANWKEVMQVMADDDAAHPAAYPWHHKKKTGSFDAASIRRGYQVYREVCSACHGINEIAFRNLDVAFTEKEIKVLAAEVDVVDGPDDKGEMFTRPGRASDYMKGPYKNEQEARAMNGGAYPPDLSVMTKARPYGDDYLFSLLIGYEEPPVGMSLREGLYFNAYFPGGAIGMAPPITVDGQVEYDDGTPSTVSQMAKDVTTFLAYCAEPEHDKRKKDGLKVLFSLVIVSAMYYYYKRFKFTVIKNRRIRFED